MVYHYTDQQFDSQIRQRISQACCSTSTDCWKQLEQNMVALPKPNNLFNFTVNNIAKTLLVLIFSGVLISLLNFSPTIFTYKKTKVSPPIYKPIPVPIKSNATMPSQASLISLPTFSSNEESLNEETKAIAVETHEVKADPVIQNSSQQYPVRKVTRKVYPTKPMSKMSVTSVEIEDSYTETHIPWDEKSNGL